MQTFGPHNAFAVQTASSPDWGAAKYITNIRGPEDIVAPQLRSWAAKKGKDDVELANARAKRRSLLLMARMAMQVPQQTRARRPNPRRRGRPGRPGDLMKELVVGGLESGYRLPYAGHDFLPLPMPPALLREHRVGRRGSEI